MSNVPSLPSLPLPAAVTPSAVVPGLSTLTADQRAQATTLGAGLTDDQAASFDLIVSASAYGRRQKIVRVGLGLVIGAAAGFALSKVL